MCRKSIRRALRRLGWRATLDDARKWLMLDVAMDGWSPLLVSRAQRVAPLLRWRFLSQKVGGESGRTWLAPAGGATMRASSHARTAGGE
jgi:hypothetical protein